MKPSDLKTGMVVEFRNGEKGVVMRGASDRDQVIGMSDGCWTAIDSIRENLTVQYSQDYDIMKVMQYGQTTFLFRDMFGCSGGKQKPEVIWTRKNPEAEKLEKVVSDLQKQLKDAQDKLAKI